MLHDIRVLCKCKTVPDALCAQQQRVDQITIRVGAHVECFSAVEEEGDLNIRFCAVLLKLEEFGDEFLDRVSCGFFADQVETSTTISIQT